MDIPLVINGFATKKISLRPRGIFSFAPKILLDGRPISRTGYGYIISDDEGRGVEFRVRHRFWDPIPDLTVGDERIEVSPPFRVYEHVWVCLPIVMVTFGGLLGGACGAIAVNTNYIVFRRVRHPALKYLFTALISLCAPVVYFLMCLVLFRAFGLGRRG